MTESGLDSVIETAAERVAPERRALLERFAELMLQGVQSHPTGGASALAPIVAEAFEWLEVRAPDEIAVRVRNREDRPGHTVIEVLQSDRPFILDTLELAFSRFSVDERFLVHPIMSVSRDESGRLVDVGAGVDGEPRESYAYVEVAPAIEPASRREEFEGHVRRVMSWVADATADHRRMVRAVRALTANLEFAGPAIEGGRERVQRVRSFLEWIIEGRFVLVGMRQYGVSGSADEPEVQIVPDSGLGMWRDDRSSRFAEPLRGDAVPLEIREDLEDPRLILISKSHMESRIHRAGRLDRILVKEYDEKGGMCGFTIVVGLFTQRVLRTPGSQIPLLAERLRRVVEQLGVPYGSHSHQAIVTAFDSLPVELLVGADVERLADLLPELVAAATSKRVRLVTRSHPRGRMLYAAVVIPRENYREDLRVSLRKLLEERTGARYIDDRTSFVEEGAALVHCFCTAAEGETIHADLQRLDEEIRQLCSPWEDQVLDALRSLHGDEPARRLAARYERAFPRALRVVTHPLDAVRDVEALEALAASRAPQCALFFDREAPERETSTLRLYLDEAPLLTDVLSVADHFGLQVVDARLFEVTPADLEPVYVESLRLLPLGASQDDLDALAPRLSSALQATLIGQACDDPLNGLVLGAGLSWKQVDLVRTYLEYFLQIRSGLSRPFFWKVLQENPLAVRTLVQWFEARFAPEADEAERAKRESTLQEQFQRYRDRIAALNEDRALQGLFNLIEATVRTSYFAPPREPHRVVLKLDSSRIAELSGAVPFREIFVHSAEMSGIHLRGGRVARGGLRWSDRHDDFRVEVLGLMRTQMLKNAIIVPVGAKGGFVLRRQGLSPSAARQAADEQYRVFVSSLLDVTDNLSPEGDVIPPEGVRRLDGDDSYLVVAADKGTAHLSDAANEIALARDFWLGDAFASGGSEGYDHKKYAITARGAWECVKHHLREAGRDFESEAYEVAGIGDMSGDVFGNGLLLMRCAKLVAAFDHRHVFLDPDPDPEASWHERKRLFELPSSSWNDYSREVLSKGGGVWPRASKSIPIPEVLQARLGVGARASGQEVVRAVLALDVDILWNAGIGTYVKASHETHADAGDRANDAVRIDATELRARIVGEGGNLGLTQAARVEAGLRGVRLDTDAIHNSAGVDLSDHEVNFKIALAPGVRANRLDPAQRRELLFGVADLACETVLSHNRGQALSISLDEIRAREDPTAFEHAIERLCEHAGLSPKALGLPGPAELAARAVEGAGLARPELSVLLGLAKLHAQGRLLEGEALESPLLPPLYASYFPEAFRDEGLDALYAHPLRREITSLCLVNRLVDAGGATLFDSLENELGSDVPSVAAALLLAEHVMRVAEARERMVREVSVSSPGVSQALVELDDGVRTVARFLVKSGLAYVEAERADRWRAALDLLSDGLRSFLSPGEVQRLDGRNDQLRESGLPEDLAARIATLPLADRGLNILRVVESTSAAPLDAARVYTLLGEDSGFNWMYERLLSTHAGSLWDRMVRVDLRHDLLDLQRGLTEQVLLEGVDDPAVSLERFLEARADDIARIRDLQQRAAATATPSALIVIAKRLAVLQGRPADGRAAGPE